MLKKIAKLLPILFFVMSLGLFIKSQSYTKLINQTSAACQVNGCAPKQCESGGACFDHGGHACNGTTRYTCNASTCNWENPEENHVDCGGGEGGGGDACTCSDFEYSCPDPSTGGDGPQSPEVTQVRDCEGDVSPRTVDICRGRTTNNKCQKCDDCSGGGDPGCNIPCDCCEGKPLTDSCWHTCYEKGIGYNPQAGDYPNAPYFEGSYECRNTQWDVLLNNQDYCWNCMWEDGRDWTECMPSPSLTCSNLRSAQAIPELVDGNYEIGDSTILVCEDGSDENYGPDSSSIQYRLDGGTWQDINLVIDSDWSQQTDPPYWKSISNEFEFSQSGNYEFRCQFCRDGECTNWNTECTNSINIAEPPAPQCTSLVMQPAAPNNPGETVTFTCSGTAGSGQTLHYQFRIMRNNNFDFTSVVSTSNIMSYTIPKYGDYSAQCRICTGTNPETCHEWEGNFNICGDYTISYGGQTYETVGIGSQCWLAENLNINPNNADNSNCSGNRYCYNNNIANCNEYGGLYRWNDIMCGESSSSSNPSGVQGICPNGWHIPSDDELYQLENYLSTSACNSTRAGDGCDPAGSRMADSSISWGAEAELQQHPDFGMSGFNAVGGGLRFLTGSYGESPRVGHLWSATELNASNSRYRAIYHTSSGVIRNDWDKGLGFSVRCIKDN